MALAALAGCSAVQSQACVDWVLFDTPADAARDHLVVRADAWPPSHPAV
ncbi:hypothetical protein [Xylanimonas sp. McL0601]